MKKILLIGGTRDGEWREGLGCPYQDFLRFPIKLPTRISFQPTAEAIPFFEYEEYQPFWSDGEEEIYAEKSLGPRTVVRMLLHNDYRYKGQLGNSPK